MWLDNYDGEFGIYRVFTNKRKCIDYLVDVVFTRAAFLEVDVLDADRYTADNEVRIELTRDKVRERLKRDKLFSLIISDGECGMDRVTVGWDTTTIE